MRSSYPIAVRNVRLVLRCHGEPRRHDGRGDHGPGRRKRAVGFKYDAEERVLARFAAFSGSQFPGLEAPTRASVKAWITSARERGVKPATLQGLAAPVRELARWLGRRGVPAYVLPGGALPRPARYVPYIYTDQELAALFAQTDRCHYDSQ